MGYRRISPDLKQRALWLLHNGYMEEVGIILNVSKSSMTRWAQNLEVYGNVVPPRNPLQGRPRALNTAQMHALIDLVQNAPEMFLDELQDWLALEHDILVAITTLHYAIQNAGLSYKLLRRRAAERDEVGRAQWMEEVQTHFVASQFVWTDKSSKDDRTIYRHYGRSALGQRATINSKFVRGERYSLLPALTIDGYIAIRVVPESVNGSEFFDFIVEDVLPQMNAYPGDRSILVMDNCAIHKSHALREVVEAQGCVIRFLPPYSPDFNPIEESFSSVKAWLRRHWKQAHDHEQPEIMLLEACGQVTAEKARGWIQHSGYNN